MLKRPKEVTFELPQPHAPYPPFPEEWGSDRSFGSWKDHNCNCDAQGSVAQHIFARIRVSPKCAPGVDPAWDAWRKHVRIHMQVPDEEQTMWDTWGLVVLEKLIERHPKVNAHLKANKHKKGFVL